MSVSSMDHLHYIFCHSFIFNSCFKSIYTHLGTSKRFESQTYTFACSHFARSVLHPRVCWWSIRRQWVERTTHWFGSLLSVKWRAGTRSIHALELLVGVCGKLEYIQRFSKFLKIEGLLWEIRNFLVSCVYNKCILARKIKEEEWIRTNSRDN